MFLRPVGNALGPSADLAGEFDYPGVADALPVIGILNFQ
jgi:hypothetical protein